MSVGVSIKTFTDRNGVKHSIEGGGGGTDPAIIEELASKADKVDGALENHLAAFDDEGNLKDGGATTQFAAASHSHTIAGVTGLQTALDGKAASSHNHDSAYESKKPVIIIEKGLSGYDIALKSESAFATLFNSYIEDEQKAPKRIIVRIDNTTDSCDFDASFVAMESGSTCGAVIYVGEYAFPRVGTISNNTITWTTGLTVARNGLLPTLS